MQQLLPGITAGEVSAAARTLLADESRVILADVAAEGRHHGADGRRAARGADRGGRGRGHAVERHDGDPRR